MARARSTISPGRPTAAGSSRRGAQPTSGCYSGSAPAPAPFSVCRRSRRSHGSSTLAAASPSAAGAAPRDLRRADARTRSMLRIAACLCFATLVAVGSAGAAGRGGEPVALITAESENQLLAVDLPSGRIVRRVTLPADPQNVEVLGLDAVVAVSTRAGAVTVLEPRSLRVIRVLRGFGAPHIAAIHPTGEWAYVTDDARGELAVIALPSGRLVRKLYVGLGAHHLAVSPGGDRLWIALGERARTIVVVDTSAPSRPRVVGRFDPGFGAHDLAFDPDGTRVWVTSDQRNDVAVFDASTRRLLFRVPVGPPPQHVA